MIGRPNTPKGKNSELLWAAKLKDSLQRLDMGVQSLESESTLFTFISTQE